MQSDPRPYNVVPNDTGDPHRRLAAAVLLRAVLDVKGAKLALEQPRHKTQVQQDALNWLHSEDAEPWAELLNIDVDVLRRVG